MWNICECNIWKYNETQINDTLELDNGSKIQISKCPNGHGKKSPLFCGQDMSCIR